MAVASFDGKIRLLSTRTWQHTFTLTCSHPRDMLASELPSKQTDVDDGDDINAGLMLVEEISGHSSHVFDSPVFNKLAASASMSAAIKSIGETGSAGAGTQAFNNLSDSQNLSAVSTTANTTIVPSFIRKSLKILPHNPVDVLKSKGRPHMGVNWMSFSADGCLIAAREESSPRCVWIWDVNSIKLINIIVQLESVVYAAWRPSNSACELAIYLFLLGNDVVISLHCS